jgi:hypothetical protein
MEVNVVPKISVIIVATSQYSKFALNLIHSIWNYNSRDLLEIHLFSDNCIRNAELIYQSVIFHTVEHEPWPLSSINRFKFILSKEGLFKGGHLIYIDADSLVHNSLLEITNTSRITFVAHPGFWKSRHLKFFTKPEGSWESRIEYSAFVPSTKRKAYVAGGVWFGPTDEIISMCRVLYNLALEDYSLNMFPIWYDESYVNWFFTYNECNLETPRFGFYSQYKYLKRINPIIEFLDKGTFFKRV